MLWCLHLAFMHLTSDSMNPCSVLCAGCCRCTTLLRSQMVGWLARLTSPPWRPSSRPSSDVWSGTRAKRWLSSCSWCRRWRGTGGAWSSGWSPHRTHQRLPPHPLQPHPRSAPVHRYVWAPHRGVTLQLAWAESKCTALTLTN